MKDVLVPQRMKYLAGAVLLVATLSGCTTSDPEIPPVVSDTLNRSGMVEEYNSVIKNLEIPGGVSYPQPPETPAIEGIKKSDVVWQRGVAEGDAVTDWNCLWGQEWLDVRNSDQAKAVHALEMYKSILEHPAFNKYFDPESYQPVVRENIEKAELGDPSGIKAEIASSCRKDLW